MKTCTKCKETLSKSAFSKNSRRKDGFDDWCKACHTNYLQTPKGKDSQRQSDAKQLAKHPEKNAARNAVKKALREGRLEKEPCHCGEIKVQGHHEDYNKPLGVEWLCTKCHRKKEKGE